VAEPAFPDYPRRPVPRDEGRRKGLPERALTNLYNDRPQWLADALAVLHSAGAVPQPLAVRYH